MSGVEISSLKVKAKDPVELAEKIHSGLKPKNVRDFLRESRLTQEQLFTAAHIPVSTGRKRLTATKFPEHESERIARIARIYDFVKHAFPRNQRALEWLLQDNPKLGGRRPIDVAGTEIGAREVENLVGRIMHGVY